MPNDPATPRPRDPATAVTAVTAVPAVLAFDTATPRPRDIATAVSVLSAFRALFNRTLLIATRAPGHHWLRTAAMVVMLLVCLNLSNSQNTAPGRDLFMTFLWLLPLLTTISCLGAFAGVVAEEKEERCLGLLRMAGVTAPGLLLGKGLPLAIMLAEDVLVLLPFAVLAVLLGGVTTGQVLFFFLLLASWVTALAGAGLLAGTWCGSLRAATGLTLLAALVGMFGLPILIGLIGLLLQEHRLVMQALGCTMLGQLIRQAGMPLGFSIAPWLGIGLHLGVGVAMAGLALRLFDRCAVDDEDLPVRKRRAAPEAVAGKANAWRPRAPTGLRALTWKDGHFTFGGWRLWWVRLIGIMLIAGLITWITAASRSSIDGHYDDICAVLFWIYLGWTVLEVGNGCATVFSDERRNGTLDGLATLPYSSAQVVWAKLWALPRLVLIPGGATVICALGAGLDNWRGISHALDEPGFWAAVMTIPYGWALAAWTSLALQRRGGLATAVLLVVLTWVATGFLAGAAGYRNASLVLVLSLSWQVLATILMLAHLPALFRKRAAD